VNELSVCSGVGALSQGLEIAIGDPFSTVCCVEREIHSAKVLASRMEEGNFRKCPIYSDLESFDGIPYLGFTDILSSGLPCQPYSLAGQRKGHEDERALWPSFVRVASECKPALVFIENVPAFRNHFEPVWAGLQELGFVWAPPLLQTASESGAPHIRERFFALAAHPQRLELREQSWRGYGPGGCRSSESGYDGEPHPDASVAGPQRRMCGGL